MGTYKTDVFLIWFGRLRFFRVLVSLALVTLYSSYVNADEARPLRRLNELDVKINQLLSEKIDSGWNQKQSIQEKLTKAELLFELGEYEKATILAYQIVQSGGNHPAWEDAIFLLGESLFNQRDYEGARKKFNQLIESSLRKSRAGAIEKRALSRLMEISVHTRDSKNLNTFLSDGRLFPKDQLDPALSYSYGRLLYNQAIDSDKVNQDSFFYDPNKSSINALKFDSLKIQKAREFFSRISQNNLQFARAQYFLGVIHTLNNELESAVSAFERALSKISKDLKQLASSEGDISELTYLALGRLYYETGALAKSVFAYQQISPNSPRFDIALYEIAWVFIRLGDADKAERSLDLLTLGMPNSPYAASGRILQGKLLTRYGKYKNAHDAFMKVKEEIKPNYEEVRKADSHQIIEQYMNNLVIENLALFDASMLLPKGLKKWAERDEKINQSLMTYLDVGQLSKTVEDTETLISKFESVLKLESPISAFADLKRHLSETKRYQEALAKVQKELIQYEPAIQNINSEKLTQIRKERVIIERKLKALAEQQSSGLGINDQLLSLYKKLERELKALEVESLGLQARLTAINKFLSDSKFEKEYAYQGDGEKALNSELEQQEIGLKAYLIRIQKIEETIELEEIKIKSQDFHGTKVRTLIAKLTDLQNREREILSPLVSQLNPALKTAFDQIERQQKKLDEHEALIEETVVSRKEKIQKLLNEEKQNLEAYKIDLASIQQESSEVIGGISYAYMQRVAKKLYNLVVQSDVGIIDVAWAEREEHRRRVDSLSRERSQELQKIDKEYNEISDEQLTRGGGL